MSATERDDAPAPRSGVRAGAEETARDEVLSGLVAYNLWRAHLSMRATLAACLAEMELRAVSFWTLSLTVENPAIIMSRLAEALGMERSNLVLVIDELERRGLITRSRTRADRRVYALSATPEGRILRDRAVQAILAQEDRLLARFGVEERRSFGEMLARFGS